MFRISKSIVIPFAHAVAGHPGMCVNIHGHAWTFEVTLKAEELNKVGFVADVGDIKNMILKPIEALLDHSLALERFEYERMIGPLATIGKNMTSTRPMTQRALPDQLDGISEGQGLAEAFNAWPGGQKIAVMPKPPTTECFAYWAADVANIALAKGLSDKGRVSLDKIRVYESPTLFAEFAV